MCSPYEVLAAVVTDDPLYRAIVRDAFMQYVEQREEAEMSNEAQYHTHVFAAPLGRWAIFYDWVADLGILSAGEEARVREMLLAMPSSSRCSTCSRASAPSTTRSCPMPSARRRSAICSASNAATTRWRAGYTLPAFPGCTSYSA